MLSLGAPQYMSSVNCYVVCCSLRSGSHVTGCRSLTLRTCVCRTERVSVSFGTHLNAINDQKMNKNLEGVLGYEPGSLTVRWWDCHLHVAVANVISRMPGQSKHMCVCYSHRFLSVNGSGMYKVQRLLLVPDLCF